MSNIFDYLKWRGDLEIEQDSFNEVDNLILSRFAYFPFDKIIKEGESITILELYNRFKKMSINKLKILQKEDIDLFPELANSKRFGQMEAFMFVNKVSSEEEKQFSAITIILPKKEIYVAFRGTDNTLVGWKEDFYMSFKNHIPAQLDSVHYLNNIAKKYPDYNIRVGGHSKGGNLAVYSAVFSDKRIQERIIRVYNNDGPGFNDDIIKTKEYLKMIDKVHTFIPQTSIIGRLLNHEEKYTVLESTQKGIMQHDLYSWQVIRNQFIRLHEVTNGSEIIDRTIKEWMQNTTPEHREEVVDTLFDILNTTKADTLSDLKVKWFKNAGIILKSYKNIDEESKEIIIKTLTSLVKIAKNNIFEQIPKIPSIRQG